MNEIAGSGVTYTVDRYGQARVLTGGRADRDAGTAWTEHVRTQVGSISKQFVAVMALLLAADSQIDLDRSLPELWPAMRADWNGVTLRQLLTHTAGVPHWHDADGYRIDERLTADERLERLLAVRLPTAPGAMWEYSSPGYLVAAASIEYLAGAPYAELLGRLVLGPLGLAETRSGQRLEPGAAIGYDGDDPVGDWDLSMMPGTGDVTSTAADIATFLRAVNSGDLVDVSPGSDYARTVDLPVDKATSSGPVRTTGYGAGHFVGSASGRQAVLNPGDNPGFKALGIWLPDTVETVVALVNDERTDIDAAAALALESGSG